jgi:hypothetical protein
MEDMFAAIVLGHLVGDYLLQPVAMALGKSEPDRNGFMECTRHCLLYSAAVCLSLYWYSDITNPLVTLAAFATHWPIDRWSLADKWMGLIRSRRPGTTYRNKELDAAFYVAVYIMTDITLHLVPLWTMLQKLV